MSEVVVPSHVAAEVAEASLPAGRLVQVAETAPRLLVEAPHWSVVRADEFGVGYGEMTFSNGEHRLDLLAARRRIWDQARRSALRLRVPRDDDGAGV